MNNDYKQQMERMRKEMFAWYKVRLSNEEKAMVVKTHGLSKFTHVAMILEDLPKKSNRGNRKHDMQVHTSQQL